MTSNVFSSYACAVLIGLVSSLARGQEVETGRSPSAWARAEAASLTDHVQLTFPERFARAGEAYFSPDARWIIFQAIPAAREGEEASAVYAMYVARLVREESGAVRGIEEPILVSAAGSANTCGFFHPSERGRVIFGSTLAAPAGEARSGYQRGTSTYAWQFPDEMEVTTRVVQEIALDGRPRVTMDVPFAEKELVATALWERAGYDAECAFHPDGRHIIYTRVDAETLDPDLYVYDTAERVHRPLVVAPGYDGGPFFSPDGSMICYRSDRAKNDLLQVYVALLKVDEAGRVMGIDGERALTANEHVNWAPFWHPSGRFLVYTTSEQGHRNYEVYAIEVPSGDRAGVEADGLRKRRLTHAEGFDGLPVFSPDGSLMMWTSQRGAKLEGEDRPSSQLWIASVVDASPR